MQAVLEEQKEAVSDQALGPAVEASVAATMQVLEMPKAEVLRSASEAEAQAETASAHSTYGGRGPTRV